MNYFVHSSYELQVDLGGLFNSSRLSTLTRIQGDAILPSTPACRKTDLSPGSPSGITRFISFENTVFHFPMILRIKKGHSFADGQNLIHSMCVKQTLKSSFLGTIFLRNSTQLFSFSNSPAVFPPFQVHPSHLELSQHQVLLVADVIILQFPPTSMTSLVKKQTQSSTGNPSHPSCPALTQTRLKTLQ